MLYLKQAVIVEGKYDKIRLQSLIRAVIIPTDGFRIFRDKEKRALIRHYAQTTGIIILTDSDAAGFQIRSHIKSFVNAGEIMNVYAPDVFGKEKRKAQPSKEGKLGVEGLDKELLLEAFARAGITGKETQRSGEPVTRLDLYEDGLFGAPESTTRRAKLLEQLHLPARMSTAALLDALNAMFTKEEYRRQIELL